MKQILLVKSTVVIHLSSTIQKQGAVKVKTWQGNYFRIRFLKWLWDLRFCFRVGKALWIGWESMGDREWLPADKIATILHSCMQQQYQPPPKYDGTWNMGCTLLYPAGNPMLFQARTFPIYANCTWIFPFTTLRYYHDDNNTGHCILFNPE